MNDAYTITATVYMIFILIGVVLGFGQNRRIVIFRDYDDLGLTFLIPASFFLIVYIFAMFGINQSFSLVLGSLVAILLTIKLLRDTYLDNNRSLIYSLLAFFTKLPLAIIWILNFINMLNPGGNTAQERRKSRQTSMVILALITPVMAALIVEKEGSLFNPQSWIKGKRVGSIRNNL